MSSKPINDSSNFPTPPAFTNNIPAMCKDLHKHVIHFTENLNELMAKPGLLNSDDFLQQVHRHGSEMKNVVEKALNIQDGGKTLLSENLKDAAEILSYIFNQPLEIPGATPNISLHGALLNYDPRNPENTDLQKILQEFVKFSGPTQTLIQELELLARDLHCD